MPHIKVDINKIRNYSSEIDSIKSRVSSIKSRYSSIASALDWDVQASSNIRSKTNNIDNDLDTELSSLHKMSAFVANAATQYGQLDESRMGGQGAVTSGVATAAAAAANVVKLTEEETDAVLKALSEESGVPKENIVADLKEGLEPAQKWLSKADEFLGKTEKFVRNITGATSLAFTFKNGHVIVSQFTRSGVLNNLTKFFHGKGIGTRYLPSTLLKTPVIGTLYAINRVATGVEVVAGVAEGVVKVLDAGAKIVDVLNDDTKSSQKKVCDATAIGITSTAAAALDVAAPFAGQAVTSAVTALIPVPGLNIVAGVVAGVAVKSVISTAADVITSEAVVNQVSESIENIGNAIESGVKSVSDAGRALLESKSVGEAVSNTAKLVGTTVLAGVNTAATVATEKFKVATTVVAETAKTVANDVIDAGKKAIDWFKSW